MPDGCAALSRRILMPSCRFALALALAVAFASGSADARPVVSLTSIPPKVHAPSNFTVDVVVSGLQDDGITLGGLDLTVIYDSSLLDFLPTAFHFGSALGIPGTQAPVFAFLSPGVFRFAEVSLLPAVQLAALQRDDSFTLATMVFYVPVPLDSGIEFTTLSLLPYDPTTPSVLSDADGFEVAFDTVDLTLKIPEPSGGLLAGIALLAMAGARRSAGRPGPHRPGPGQRDGWPVNRARGTPPLAGAWHPR